MNSTDCILLDRASSGRRGAAAVLPAAARARRSRAHAGKARDVGSGAYMLPEQITSLALTIHLVEHVRTDRGSLHAR